MTLNKSFSEKATLLFVVIMCFSCGVILSTVAYTLRIPQEQAREFDQSKQMLIAARMLNHSGYFTIISDSGEVKHAHLDELKGELVEDPSAPTATDDQIRLIIEKLIYPLVTNSEGTIATLDEKKIDLLEYLDKHKKMGYALQTEKLFYVILPTEYINKNISAQEVVKIIKSAQAIVIPISGFGLWAPIYGYLALRSDGDTVIGTTWYEMGETPGLGANITEASWQDQFLNKKAFHEQGSGKTDYKTADLGIIVVKGKVQNVYGNAPIAKSAVDGMSGATLTGEGVTAAYEDSLSPYRRFLMKLNEEKSKDV